MIVEQILASLGLIEIGGILQAVVTYIIGSRKKKSDAVILKMKELLEKQTRNSYSSLILEMRENLYRVKTKLTSDTFRLGELEVLL